MVMTPQQFYANIGDRFGATEGRPNPHRGQDYPWGAGTEIPAFRDLLHLANYYHSGLGNVALAQGADGVLVGFSHLLQPCYWKPGQVIRYGQTIGLVGNTGTLSKGNHLHQTASWSSWSPWAGPWIDPLKYTQDSLNGIALGGGGVPSTGTPTNGDSDMPLTEADIFAIWTFPIANGAGVRGRAADWLTNLSDAHAKTLAKVTNVEGVATRIDQSVPRIEAAIKGLSSDGFTPEQIKTIADRLGPALKIPTAAENGAAARAAIVRP